jgi:pimeloyl-ACP methyl ester carboxylesterase
MKKGKSFFFVLFLFLSFYGAATAQVKARNIVLVHGAFADGSGWQGVYKFLTQDSFHVSVVANPLTGFTDDVAAVKRVIDRQDGPVILVGHSYGGAVITEAGNDPKVVGLVYIAAFMPDSGETLIDLIKAGLSAPTSGVLPPDANGFLWYDKATFHASFCADLPDSLAAFMADSQVPLAASVFGASVNHPAWKTKKTWYVVANQDHELSPEKERFLAKRAGASTIGLDGSHVVFISQPKTVASIIETAAYWLAGLVPGSPNYKGKSNQALIPPGAIAQ